MICPSDDELAAYVDGRLEPSDRAAIRHHLLGCDPCAELVAGYAQAWSMSPGDVSSPTIPSFAEDELPTLPDKLDRYEVRERIGVGGMGEVLIAFDPVLGRDVAIKRLLSPDRTSALREARFAARLEHPNIVEIYDVVQADGDALIVMEYVDGAPLSRWLEASRDPFEILEVFRQAGMGLAAAHDAGVIHRDFKPHNALVGRGGRVRITDFGLARDKGDQQPGSGGTRTYAAPEQTIGGEADAASDQYSYCCALLEAVLGRRPEPGECWQDLLRETPERWSGPAGRQLTRVLRRGLELRVTDRWPSMHALVEALPPSRRKRGRLAVAAIGVALTVSAAAWVVVKQPTPTHLSSAFVDTGAVAGTIASRELEVGRSHSARRQYDQARPHLELAARAATLAGADETSADAALLLMADAVNTHELARGRRWHRHARAAVGRLPLDSPLHTTLAAYEASLLAIDGDGEAAVERALEAQRRILELPDDDPQAQLVTHTLSVVLLRAGRAAEALELAERAMQMRSPSSDSETADLLPVLQTLALAQLGVGRHRPAAGTARELSRRTTAHLGPDSLGALEARAFLGSILADTGELAQAEAVLQPAVEELGRRSDPNDPHIAHLRGQLAHLQRSRGALEASVATYHAVVEAQRVSLPPGHPNLAWSKRGLADALFAQGQTAEALSMAWSATNVDDSFSLVLSYETVARIYAGTHEPEMAMMHFHLAAFLSAAQPGSMNEPREYLAEARRVAS